MIRNRITGDKKRHLTVIGSTVAITLLVASIIVVGVAQSSYAQQQQQQLRIARGFITSFMIADNTIVSADLKDGAAVRSEDIVDGQVNTEDLAEDAVTSDKIANGEVKAEDLDPSIQLGGGGSTSDFNLQVTERSNSIETTQLGIHPLAIQCNSDEVVTGGGFSIRDNRADVIENKKQDNGWKVSFIHERGRVILTVHAECLKVVQEGTTG